MFHGPSERNSLGHPFGIPSNTMLEDGGLVFHLVARPDSGCISVPNDLEDHPDKVAGSGCDSSVSQDDHDLVARIEKASELQMN